MTAGRGHSYIFPMRGYAILAIILLLMAGPYSHAGENDKPPVNQGAKTEAFHQLFSSLFNQWDINHDGALDLTEIDTAINDPSVQGNESAIAVVFRRHLLRDQRDKTNEINELSLAEVLSLADDPQVQRAISGDARHIQSINHSLFLPEDPNLVSFHQGSMGDCYFLAVAGALVYYQPQMVRAMIKPEADGSFEVRFGNGKNVAVGPLTDAELILGATEGRSHGIWLSVLEKAFAELQKQNKERKTGQEIGADQAVFSDFIGRGGNYRSVIVLFTGHHTAAAPMGRWFKQDPQDAAEKMDGLLTKISSEHRLAVVATSHDKSKILPKGIPHGHALAVLGYNAAARTVVMFNPWGNTFRPRGPAGLVNGYPTRQGIFDVPLTDFMQTFSGFTYETDKPALVDDNQVNPSPAKLIEQFKNSQIFWQQFEIAEKIVALHDTNVLQSPVLTDDLTNEDRHVRGNAALIFAALGDNRGFDVIENILNDRSSRPEGQGDGYPWTLQGQIAADRYDAAHLFGDLKNPRAVPVLIPLLQDDEVNYIVPWSLGAIGDKRAIPALIEALDDKAPSIRVLAIYALEMLDAVQALPRLRELLNDHQRSNFGDLVTVADAAHEAIIKLTPPASANPGKPGAAAWQTTLRVEATNGDPSLVPCFAGFRMFYTVPAPAAAILESQPHAQLEPFLGKLRTQLPPWGASTVGEWMDIVRHGLRGTPGVITNTITAANGIVCSTQLMPVYYYSESLGTN